MDRDPRLDPLPGDELAYEAGSDPVVVTGRAGTWVAFRVGGATPIADVAWWRGVHRRSRVLAVADLGDAYFVPPAATFEEARRLLA